MDVSATLPMEQQAWSCPVQGCRAGLGELPPQDRKRAIKKHIADAHPGETLRSLANLARKGGKNEGVSKNLQRIHATVRKKTFKTHDVVRIVPHERKERCQRGDLYLCKVCLTLMGKNLSHLSLSASIRRAWWRRVRQSEPRLAQSVSEALGRSFVDLDEAFGRDHDTKGARRWRRIQAAKKSDA